MTNQLLKPLERWMKLAVIPPAGAAVIRLGRSGVDLVVTPDGPNGPRQVAKMGVIRLARASRLPIIPLAFSCSKKTLCELGPFHGAICLVAGSFPVGTALVGLAGRRCGGLGSHAWSWKRS